MNVMDGSRWILATLLALSGLACSKSNVSPAPWAQADAALDKVGVPVVLHFNVGPAAIKSGRRAMLAIVYPQSGDGKVEDCIRRTEPAFKVALQRDAPGAPMALAIEDDRTILSKGGNQKVGPASGPLSSAEVARLALATTDGHAALALIGGFRPTGTGSFTATITSLPGTSCFAGVSGKVIVDEFYNTGK